MTEEQLRRLATAVNQLSDVLRDIGCNPPLAIKVDAQTYHRLIGNAERLPIALGGGCYLVNTGQRELVVYGVEITR